MTARAKASDRLGTAAKSAKEAQRQPADKARCAFWLDKDLARRLEIYTAEKKAEARQANANLPSMSTFVDLALSQFLDKAEQE